jgi:hypothetical protein
MGFCIFRGCALDSAVDVLSRLRREIPTPSHLGFRRTELRFTVHRPASAEVSPCCHRPSGGDVVCGIGLSVADQRCRLLTAWDQVEAAHTSKITATTDKLTKGEKRRFLPR